MINNIRKWLNNNPSVPFNTAQRKIEVNERRYPVDKAKGNVKKYTGYV
jgi:hypothetical protein